MAEIEEKKNEEAVISMPLDGPSLPPTSEDTRPEGAQPPDNEETNKGRSAEDIVKIVLICIVIIPLYLFYVLAAYVIYGIDVTEESKPKKKKQGKNDLVYRKCKNSVMLLFVWLIWFQ
ncbi:hypothetical protein Ancab_012474 [Ancistrocladus abbreviatus]